MSYVLADMRGWNPDMAENVARRLGQPCLAISDPRDLTIVTLDKIMPKLVFFPFWSNPIPREIFERYVCIIFHMTDVPFGRTAELDAGDVYLKRPLDLAGSAQDIYQRASRIIEDMIVDIVDKQIEPQPQQGEVARFQRRRPEQSDISDLDDLGKVYDYIRMLDANGYPHAFVETGLLRFEFRGATKKDDAVQAKVVITVKNNGK